MTDIEKVKYLGESIGYGHLMSLASALWHESMIKSNYPTSGIFVPVPLSFCKDGKELEISTKELNNYINYINKSNNEI